MQKHSGLTAILLIVFLVSTNLKINAQDDNRFYVYSESYQNCVPSGMMGSNSGQSIKYDPYCTINPLKGEKCLKTTVDGSEGWCGTFFCASGDWRGVSGENGKYADLEPYKYLVFSVRSDTNFTLPVIGMGNEGIPDGMEESSLRLTKNWDTYVIEIPKKLNLEKVNGVFRLLFEGNVAGTIYFDEVFYADSSYKPIEGSKLYLQRAEPMDSTSIYIYADGWVNGNPNGKWGEKNGSGIRINSSCREKPYLGPKCMKLWLDGEAYAGITVLQTGQWDPGEDRKDELLQLDDYDRLEFYARSDKKGVNIGCFGFGGDDQAIAQSDSRAFGTISLSTEWKQYSISLKGAERSYVNSIMNFCMPDNGIVYLDEIRFVRSTNNKTTSEKRVKIINGKDFKGAKVSTEKSVVF